MVNFTLRQVTTIVDGPAYQVTNQVVAAAGSDTSVFVFAAASQKFSHYAGASDMTLPTSYQLAQVQTAKFYRLAILTRVWPSVIEMNADLDDTLRRVQSLADELNAQRGSLIIDRTIVVQGS